MCWGVQHKEASGQSATKARWVAFNDFVIRETPSHDVQDRFGGQKTPCLLYYSRVRPVPFGVDQVSRALTL